jgi:CheY-like chemotaxis protein/HPt (histidine-containing phosphotransfer) domain-containing protein
VIREIDQAPRGADRDCPGVEQAVSPVRILVVDDDPITRDVALLMLDRLGYRADTAGNGLEALATARAKTYDVILMDLQLPEMTGMKATRRIRSELPTSLQPTVIAMTASSATEMQALCLQAGMDGYLTKPIHIRELAVVLEAWSSRSDRAVQPVQSAPDVGESTSPIGSVAPILPITPVGGWPVYDPVPLDELVAALGPASGRIRQELIERFLDGGADWVVAIGLAAPSNDGEALAFSAHAMKSASATLGLVALSEAAGRVESAYQDTPEAMDVASEAVRLVAHHNRATAVLRAVLESDGGKEF